ncbi:MAG TPA: NFACT RNA binding domain-containing protein [Candidatus Eisenbacteria bacterium]|jgi:predicted ribosome quality control (RQC) complex YloA/Tae2 family protein
MVERASGPERRAGIARVLRRYHARLARRVEALRGDLAEAGRAEEWRRYGEALLAYLHQVPARARQVTLPDPADPGNHLLIDLDPDVAPQANAARYFKRAAKGQRGLKQIPPRLSAAEAEAHALGVLLARLATLEEGASDSARTDDLVLDQDLEGALAKLPPGLRGVRRAPVPNLGSPRAGSLERAPSARLQPRRLRTREGWHVLVGRTNEGNDYLTHHLARPEDYWFHVHGAAGSHVVLRRGKGKSEPSKRTIAEVAGWAAFYSQARTAGQVPVIVTRKKHVRKPRKGPPGLALCTHEKTVMVRPAEPPRQALERDAAV